MTLSALVLLIQLGEWGKELDKYRDAQQQANPDNRRLSKWATWGLALAGVINLHLFALLVRVAGYRHKLCNFVGL